MATCFTFSSGQDDASLNCEQYYQSVVESKGTSTYDKKLAFFEYRICRKNILRELESFSVSDGIDEFEAWLLATLYREREFGVCGRCHVPTQNDHSWEVVFGFGAPPVSRGPMIVIDASSGILHCEGHPALSDPMALIREELVNARERLSKTPEQRRAELLKMAKQREAEIQEQLRQNAARKQPSP